jgi:phytoene dehydrogenase-like protein
MSAGTALAQVQNALGTGVTYLDGGWQTLVDGLRTAATAAGVQIVTGSRVAGIEDDGQVRTLRLADGTTCPADAVIIAGSPASAAELIGGAAGEPLRRWAAEAIPVKAACLDVGLARLPRPQARFALGIDQPFYCSLHSAVAKLAPADGAMIHVAKYLDPSSDTDAKSDERELEGVLDLVQPGWREVVTERRFLPSMVVANALTTAGNRGTTGRPGPAVPGIANVYVSGDWVGTEGLLADASLASARQAAALILRQTGSASAAAAA